MTSISFIINYYFNYFEVIFLTYGVGVGFGTGIIAVANSAILPHYFVKRFNFATGISQTGTAVGMFIFSGLNEFLLNEYGLKGTFLILSAISLNAIPLGLLIRDPISTSKIKGEEERQALISNCKDIQQTDILRDKSDCFNDTCKEDTQNTTSIWSGLELLKNNHFVLLMLANFLVIISHYVIPTMLPEHIVLMGGSTKQGASTIVIIGAANIFSRLVLWNIKTDHAKTLMVILTISSVISGASLMFSILYTEYWAYVCLCITFGLTRGIYIINEVLLTVKIVGTENCHHAFGITFTVWGLGILIGLPGCGVLANITSVQFQYSIVFMCVGSAEVLAGVLFIIMYATWNEH